MTSAADILDALHDVIDPELGFNIVDLGLIYELTLDEGRVKVTMTMTTPGCPAQDYLCEGVAERARQIDCVADVEINLVWDPPWSPQKMSPIARDYFGIAEDRR